MNILIDNISGGCSLLKKVIMSIPFIFFILFVTWGFMVINIQNTKASNEVIENNESIDFEKMKELGLDFKFFVKDKSEIKIYHSNNDEFYMNYKDYEIDFNNSLLKPVLINFMDGTDYILSKVGNGIGYVIKKVESIA